MYGEAHGDFIANRDRYRPMFALSVQAQPHSRLASEPGEFDNGDLLLQGAAPVAVDPDTALLVGGRAEARRFEFSVNSGLPNDSVYSVGAVLGAGRFVNDDTYVEAVFEPGIYSDFGGTLTHNDWQFLGHATATYRYSEEVYFTGGIKVSRDFEKVPVFPVLGVAWLFDPNWRVDVMLPLRAELSWLVSVPTTVFVGAEIEGHEYSVRSSAATGKQQHDINIQDIRLYIGANHRVNDNFSMFARTGAVVGGDYRFTPSYDGQIEPTFMLELGLGWDF